MAPPFHLHLPFRRLLPLLLLVAVLRLPTSSGAAAVVEDHHPWVQGCFKILDGMPDALKRQCTSNWIDLPMAILCVLGAALASGLTVGLKRRQQQQQQQQQLQEQQLRNMQRAKTVRR